MADLETDVLTSSVRERVSRRWRPDLGERLFSPDRTAFVVVDMQNYYLKDHYPTFCAAGLDIVEPINTLARQLGEKGVRSIFVRSVALEAAAGDWANMYAMLRERNQQTRYAALADGADGHAMWSGLELSHAGETVDKTRFSGFAPGASDLDQRLRSHGIETILVAGVLTNVCCDSTARDAMMLGYNAVMVHDCLAAAKRDEHRSSLATFALYFGEVLGSSEIVDRIGV